MRLNGRFIQKGGTGYCCRNRAFTLMEIMVVVGLMAIVMAVGIPAFVRTMRKEGMQRGVSDFVDACRQVRANAILSGKMQELIIHPKTGQFEVTGPTAYSSTFPDNVHIDILGVNFVELQEEEEAHIKFQPGATCDEFTMVLSSPGHAQEQISLEVVTGLVSVEQK